MKDEIFCMYRLKNIKIKENLSNEEVLESVLKKVNIPRSSVDYWRIFKKSIDARDKDNVHFVYTIDIDCSDKKYVSKLEKVENVTSTSIEVDFECNIDSPVVVGAGPARIICSIYFSKKWI